MAFNPVDGTIASGGQDNAVRLWGGPGGDRTLGSHDGPVDSVAFSPDGRWLATGSDDKTVRVWDLSGQEQPRIIRSHQAGVLSVAFAGNDRVVSGGLDAVRVTDWRDGVTLLTIPRGAWTVATSGTAPAIAWFDTADNIVREIECDVCGPIDDVQAAAEGADDARPDRGRAGRLPRPELIEEDGWPDNWAKGLQAGEGRRHSSPAVDPPESSLVEAFEGQDVTAADAIVLRGYLGRSDIIRRTREYLDSRTERAHRVR